MKISILYLSFVHLSLIACNLCDAYSGSKSNLFAKNDSGRFQSQQLRFRDLAGEDGHEDEHEHDHDHEVHDHGDEDEHEDEHVDEHDDHNHSEHSNEDEESSGKPWGEVIGFSFLVTLVTFSGVFLLAIPSIRAKVKNPPCSESDGGENGSLIDLLIPSFATGALLSTVIFLVLPESLVSLNQAMLASAEGSHDGHDHRLLRSLEGDDHSNHAGEIMVGAIWRFGTALLAGYLLPLLFEVFTPKSTEPVADAPKDDSVENNDSTLDYALIASVVLGDFCHNFCDGVFIAVAFLHCNRSMAYTIVGVTAYHEVAQEIADFMILTRMIGLDVKTALFFNFLSGISVVFGGILVLAADISQLWIGVLLAMSSGVYMLIACSECFPRAKSNIKTNKDIAAAILAFLCGAIPIGLTLLNHVHCEIHD